MENDISTIDVWNCSLSDRAEIARLFTPFLSDDEKQRALRFQFKHLGYAYTVGRGMTRIILARYLEKSPADLRFIYGPKGKPHLASASSFHFNVSHSGAAFVCAVTGLGELGVDVEEIKPQRDAIGIAKRFFSRAEASSLSGLSDDEVSATFVNCWTRKEAFIKATGQGLTRELASFEVTCRDDEPVKILHISDPRDDPTAWSLHAFVPAQGYRGAIAIRHPKISVRYIDMTPSDLFSRVHAAEFLASSPVARFLRSRCT